MGWHFKQGQTLAFILNSEPSPLTPKWQPTCVSASVSGSDTPATPQIWKHWSPKQYLKSETGQICCTSSILLGACIQTTKAPRSLARWYSPTDGGIMCAIWISSVHLCEEQIPTKKRNGFRFKNPIWQWNFWVRSQFVQSKTSHLRFLSFPQRTKSSP